MNLEGYPIVDEPVTVNIATRMHASTAHYDNLIVFQEMEKLTNVKVNWIVIPWDGFVERRNISFATGDLPDAYTKAGMSVNDVMKFATSGAMVPLNPYLETYAPNLNSYLQANPAVNAGVTMLDGNIYGAPYILESSAIRSQARMFFDVELMSKVGGSMPKTTDDFIEYLKLIRDNDANGNGDPNDEVPLVSGSLGHIAQMTAGSFGLNMNGASHALVDMPAGSNDLRFLPTENDYREHMKFLRTLYAERLVDQEIFTMTSTKALSQVSQKQMGAIVWWSVSFISGGNDDDYTHLERQLIGPNGHNDFTCVIGSVNSPAAFIITSKCKVPEILVRWIDYFYSEEGITLYLLGVEGTTFEWQSDGKPVFKDIIMKNPDGLSFQQAYGLFCPQAGGGNPTILTEKLYISGEGLPKSRAASDSMKEDIIDFADVWENFIYTSAEAEVMSSISADIASYVNESRAKFVSGELDIFNDSVWDAYVREFKNIGLDNYMTLYRIGYDRFKGN
jgi:putative aldouronate transport system substrate-binding protein